VIPLGLRRLFACLVQDCRAAMAALVCHFARCEAARRSRCVCFLLTRSKLICRRDWTFYDQLTCDLE